MDPLMRHLSCHQWILLYFPTFCYLRLFKDLRIKKINLQRKKKWNTTIAHLTLLVITARVSHPTISLDALNLPSSSHSLTHTRTRSPIFFHSSSSSFFCPSILFLPVRFFTFFSLFLPLSTAIITSPIIAVTSEMIK